VRPPEGSGIIAQQQAERSFRNNKLSTARGPRNIAQQQAEHRNKLRGASDLERRRCYPRMLDQLGSTTNLHQQIWAKLWIHLESLDDQSVVKFECRGDPFGINSRLI
jgi:hypothetical protein